MYNMTFNCVQLFYSESVS